MNGESEQPIVVSASAKGRAENGLQRWASNVRSVYHWVASAIFFFPASTCLLLLGFFVHHRKYDRAQRFLCRTTMKLAGAKLSVERTPGFDPTRTCFLLANHVNLFDPFVLYATIPQFFRGLELESHFRIPVYGWMMKRFGNVPVPGNSRPSDLKKMWRLTRASLDADISLLAFPEGQRTIGGHVGPFKEGVFRMALQFGTPIVPVTMVGSFNFNRKTGWMIRPGKITVVLHDVIETKNLRKEDLAALRDRVHAIISAPLESPPSTGDPRMGSSAGLRGEEFARNS